MNWQPPNLKNSNNTLDRLLTTAYLGLCGLFSVILIQTGNAVYEAGTGDHLVVSPAGLLRADPSLYLNDFFIRQAKMPHWAFEFYTALASRLDQLGPMYFAYWLLTALFCAYAHLIIARKVSSRFSYPLAIVMFTTQLMGSRIMFGTSGVVLNQALPHGLAASIGFVVIASLLTNKRNIVFIYLPILPLIHIQIGTIVVGLVMVLIVVEKIGGQAIRRVHLVSFGLSVCSILFGLRYRPIAGNIQDFSRLCRDLAPHHCYSPSWSHTIILGCLAILAVALIGFFFISNSVLSFWQRLTIFVLPTIALAVTLFLDRNDLGWLANFVRGNNVYRVAVVLLPWLYWVPVLIASSEGRKAWKLSGIFVSVLLLITLMTLTEHGNYLESKPVLLIALFAIVGCVYFVDRSNFLQSNQILFSLLMVCVACVPALSGLKFGQDSFGWPNLTFEPDSNIRSFGESLRLDVKKGQVVVGDPAMSWTRMASGIAYGVDCKFRPIGGGEPLNEYYDRINPLGGYDKACNYASFSTVSVDDLIRYYQASSADLLLISPDDARLAQLTAIGWKTEPSVHVKLFGWVLVGKPG